MSSRAAVVLTAGLCLGFFLGELSAPAAQASSARGPSEQPASTCAHGRATRVLALDSSLEGLRSLLVALADLDEALGGRLPAAIDVVVGTGAGAIAAAALAAGATPAQLVGAFGRAPAPDISGGECADDGAACPAAAAARCVLLRPQANLTALVARLVDEPPPAASRDRPPLPALAIALFDLASGRHVVVQPTAGAASIEGAAAADSPSFELSWLVWGTDAALGKQPLPPLRLHRQGTLARGTTLENVLLAAAATPLLAAPRNLTCIGCEGGGDEWGSPYSACTSWKTRPRLCSLVGVDGAAAGASAAAIGNALADAGLPNGCAAPVRVDLIAITAHSSASLARAAPHAREQPAPQAAPAANARARPRGHGPPVSAQAAPATSRADSGEQALLAAVRDALGADASDATWGPFGQMLAPRASPADAVRSARDALESTFIGQMGRSGVELLISVHPPPGHAPGMGVAQRVTAAVNGQPATREVALRALRSRGSDGESATGSGERGGAPESAGPIS
ncbi:hypothetical protein KFE25_009479 [Diacronema lutheri]|uniref:PNPLA domain-containing protein n=3 Tax=Diacronema lutheri TaxID=2081491 RepID=A0A8J5XSU8_DIALT|nr:hypothetical protein KFE25_009479 [Diacronema lutheri]